ncbi:MAG: T9SS type A sorting domain-containing protein [Chitinophagaceae bacterium]|nr:T9SS type A sorting domain-containing protein [Chitinophagaceae bacterium]
MKKNYILFICFILPLLSSSQDRGNIWCFGDSAGIDFNNLNNPIPINTGLRTRGSCASISDTTGNLLFYAGDRTNTAGDYTTLVYNNEHNVMPNGDSIVGEGWYNEIIILPMPENDSIFFLFVISTALGPGGLYYSIINMNADSGRGNVISKNNQLQIFSIVDCLNAIKHGNGRDWWLMFRRYDGTNTTTNNEFYSYLISPNGITNFQMQQVGSLANTGLGQLKFNSTGDRMVFNSFKGTLELFEFDRCTGVISNSQVIFLENSGPPWPARWSSEFSPDGNYLYVCNNPDSTFLYQYDLNSTNISSSQILLWMIPKEIQRNSGGLLKLGPNNKIYFSSVYYNGFFPYPYPDSVYNMYNMNLGVIHFPDSLGTLCDFQPYSFYLGGKRTYWGLPNNPDYDMPALTGSPCDSLTSISDIPISSEAELFVYYASDWQTAFINANKIKGTNYHLEVFDLLGKSIFRESGKMIPPYYTKNLNCAGFAKGMYVVNLVTNKEKITKRFIVQ